jgi:hypothetical protein
MEYYSAIKTNEITLFAGKWMVLEIIKLSERSQTERQMLHALSQMWKLDLKKKKKKKKNVTSVKWGREKGIVWGAYQREGEGGGISWKYFIHMYESRITKLIKTYL